MSISEFDVLLYEFWLIVQEWMSNYGSLWVPVVHGNNSDGRNWQVR